MVYTLLTKIKGANIKFHINKKLQSELLVAWGYSPWLKARSKSDFGGIFDHAQREIKNDDKIFIALIHKIT